MGERKVVQKYYPPDFDPSKLPRVRRQPNQQMKVRNMVPMRVRCNNCGKYIGEGTKLNCRKEVVTGKTYLGIPIVRFYYKCNDCSAEIIITTDPQNSDYAVESGAKRCYEHWLAEGEDAVGKRRRRRELEEKGNRMKALENRTLDSKREMDDLAKLDEVKSMNAIHATVSVNAVLEMMQSSAAERKKREEEEDEKLIKLNFPPRPKEADVKRISDEEFEHGDLKRQKVSKETSVHGGYKPCFMIKKPVN
ncbi:CWC16 protein [Corchorus olitorius]|uniref:Splicing factor YJU2 n=1 Tax=Corchorus olitorius TaxID=93759 RepID=A0A1R3JNF3_9ROSI|nr:CWC16 protein [Corchorus olitorius]